EIRSDSPKAYFRILRSLLVLPLARVKSSTVSSLAVSWSGRPDSPAAECFRSDFGLCQATESRAPFALEIAELETAAVWPGWCHSALCCQDCCPARQPSFHIKPGRTMSS